MSRDDFPASVKRELERRVASRCSNPDCRAPTRGPHSDVSKSTSVGVAAHISGAAAGGPRYDASLSPEERSAIGNGIWLCHTCSRIVDDDWLQYPIELLRGWKASAEHDAHEALGKTAPFTVPPTAFFDLAAQLAQRATHVRRLSELSRDQAMQLLEGAGYVVPISGEPEIIAASGMLMLNWRSGRECCRVMAFDLPGGVLDNRISLVRNEDNSFTLRVLDAHGIGSAVTSAELPTETMTTLMVAWSASRVTLWANEEEYVLDVSAPFTHLGPKLLLGLDIEGKLSAENARRGYRYANVEGFNFQRDGIWQGTVIPAVAFTFEVPDRVAVRTAIKNCDAHFSALAATPALTLEFFLKIVDELSSSAQDRYRCAILLRDLLITGYPTIQETCEAVARITGDATPSPMFRVAQLPELPPIMKNLFTGPNSFLSIQDGIDPDSAPPKYPRRSVGVDELRDQTVAQVDGRWLSVQDYIEAIAAIAESAPRGIPLEDHHKVLLRSNLVSLGGVPVIERQIDGIRSVVLKGCGELIAGCREALAGGVPIVV